MAETAASPAHVIPPSIAPDNPVTDAHQLLSVQTRQILDDFCLQDVGSHLLRRAHFVAEDLFAQAFPGDAITPRQKAALIIAYQQPGLNQNALAEHLSMDRNSVAEMVKRLVAGKLLRRQRAVSDKRAYKLYLAPCGAILLNNIMARDIQLERELLERLPTEYRPLFLKCLRILISPNGIQDEAATLNSGPPTSETPAGN